MKLILVYQKLKDHQINNIIPMKNKRTKKYKNIIKKHKKKVQIIQQKINQIIIAFFQ